MEGRSSEYKKGLWTVEEDKILADYIRVHGKGKWNRVAKVTGQFSTHWEKNLSTLSKSDFTPRQRRPSCNEVIISSHQSSQEVNENGCFDEHHQSCPPVGGLSGSQEFMMMRSDDYHENCFWFSNDELDLQPPNSSMEFLDKSLDFSWHGL
ncbi:hypothetical protein JRO89_XS13G0194400 [Xanthoceras sorbifolium]|uniref:Uncharacterized protein n=1 Tax=Xanthoceras sorbifolium TaxID=99658 RepID=A0ABQ8H946_9ROSI|nr:hypothetical protein JRO89_XS13G0194400 [Xanthoceras sorbifolium]